MGKSNNRRSRRLRIVDKRKFFSSIGKLILACAVILFFVFAISNGWLREGPEETMSPLEKYPTQQDWIDEINSWQYK